MPGRGPAATPAGRSTDRASHRESQGTQSDPRVAGLVADLDRLGVPANANRRAARKALSDARIKAGNDLIDKAQETRQNHDQVRPAQINNSELFEIIGAMPPGTGPETNKPSSERARHTPGTSGTGAIVPQAECAAPIPCPYKGTGEGTPPAPGPDTASQPCCITCGQRLLLTHNPDSSQRTQCEHCRIDQSKEKP